MREKHEVRKSVVYRLFMHVQGRVKCIAVFEMRKLKLACIQGERASRQTNPR